MMKFSVACGVLLLSFIVASVSVSAAEETEVIKTKADTNREVALTYAQIYLEQKLYDEAENALQLSLKNDGENGSILNFLGLIQLQQKNYSQACYSFQTAGIVFQDPKDRVYALYNLADCFHQGKRRQDSINVLKDLIQKEEGISDTAEKALELIEAGVLQPGAALPPFQKRARGQFRLSLALAGGFDTNVLLVEEDVAKGIAVKDRGSLYIAPAMQFGYLGRLFGQTLDSRIVTAYTDYLAVADQPYNSLYNRIDMLFGSSTIKWGFFADLTLLNRNSFGVYNYDAGLVWQQVKKTGPNDAWIFEVPFKYQKFVLQTTDSSINDRSGGDVQLKVTRRSQWSDHDSLSILGNLDNQYTVGHNYRLTGLTVPVVWTTSLPVFSDVGLTNSFTGEIGYQYYWQSDVSRKDLEYKIGTGISTVFFESWNLGIDFYYMSNNSNVTAATYTKCVTSFLLSHIFI